MGQPFEALVPIPPCRRPRRCPEAPRHRRRRPYSQAIPPFSLDVKHTVVPQVIDPESSRLTGSLPPTRDEARTNSPDCSTSRLQRHAASASPPAECGRSWHTGSLALSTRHSSLLHASSHYHSHS